MRLVAVIVAAGGIAVSAQAVHVVAKIRVGASSGPCAAAAGGRWVWVAEFNRPKLLKVDPRSNKIRGAATVGNGACGLAFGARSMWVEDTYSDTVSRVSVNKGKRTATIPVGATPYDTTFAFGSAWTTANSGNQLDRIDPAKNSVVARVPVNAPVGVVAAFGSVWVAGTAGVTRVDPKTNKKITTIPISSAGWTAASRDSIWITAPGKLVRIDPNSGAVAATVPMPAVPLGDPDVVAGTVWVPVISQNRVAVVDPSTNNVVQSVKTGPGPFVVTAHGHEAWVPSWHGSNVYRFRTS
jgi:hypothetical protein